VVHVLGQVSFHVGENQDVGFGGDDAVHQDVSEVCKDVRPD